MMPVCYTNLTILFKFFIPIYGMGHVGVWVGDCDEREMSTKDSVLHIV